MGGEGGASKLTWERLVEVLRYEPETGYFFHITARSNRIKSGDKAGVINVEGYCVINIDCKKYYAHRLAWLYIYRCWPLEEIDHKNRDKSDNRINNLREATRAQNSRNKPKSGFRGYYWVKEKNKWRAAIQVNRKRKFLGYFDSKKKAAAISLKERYGVDRKFYDFSS